MLQSTFLHIPRTGPTTEQKLWRNGVKTWQDFLSVDKIKGFSEEKKAHGNTVIQDSKRALVHGNSAFFTSLPSTSHWRLYPVFKDEAVFVDIETNWQHDVTVLGIYDGKKVKQFIRGENLNAANVREHIDGKMIVTYNGASFDLPVIKRCFGASVVPVVPHFDTMHLARRLGYSGGLKALEKSIGISRPDEVQGMSGEDALHLWDLYRASGDEAYLKRLLAYNEEDIVNLAQVANKLVSEATKALAHAHGLDHLR